MGSTRRYIITFLDNSTEIYLREQKTLVVEYQWIRINDHLGALYKIIPLHRVKEVKYE